MRFARLPRKMTKGIQVRSGGRGRGLKIPPPEYLEVKNDSLQKMRKYNKNIIYEVNSRSFKPHRDSSNSLNCRQIFPQRN